MSSSVVQTKRAVCLVLEMRTWSQLTPCRVEPAAVVAEVLPGRADEQRLLAEGGHAEADVAGHSPSADLERVREEAHRDLVELLDDEGVGEPTLEGHEVVGRDGPSDSDTHVGKLYPATGVYAGT